MNLHESVQEAILAFEKSLPESNRNSIDKFQTKYQKLLDLDLIEKTEYNLAPISTLRMAAWSV